MSYHLVSGLRLDSASITWIEAAYKCLPGDLPGQLITRNMQHTHEDLHNMKP
jgi:hypothetical protein